jgi:hypothetical protein
MRVTWRSRRYPVTSSGLAWYRTSRPRRVRRLRCPAAGACPQRLFEVEETHAVRSADGHAGGGRDRCQPGIGARMVLKAGVDDRGPGPGSGRGLELGFGMFRLHREQGQVGRLWQLGQGGHAPQPFDLFVPGIDRMHRSGEPALEHLAHEPVPGRARPRACTHDRDGARRQQLLEPWPGSVINRLGHPVGAPSHPRASRRSPAGACSQPGGTCPRTGGNRAISSRSPRSMWLRM